MVICRDCGKEIINGQYQEIHTKRKTKIYICNECVKKLFGKEVINADNSKQSV